WNRDQGRCQEPLASGGICGSTHRVEFHHRKEHARGGPATSSNLTLRCSFHNFRAAEHSYGEEFMHRFRRSAPGKPPDAEASPDTECVLTGNLKGSARAPERSCRAGAARGDDARRASHQPSSLLRPADPGFRHARWRSAKPYVNEWRIYEMRSSPMINAMD